MELIFTLLFLSQLATPLECDKGAFAYLITSSSSCGVDPVYGVGLERTVTAVDAALSHVNSRSDLLPAINLSYGASVNTLECPVTGNSLAEVLHLHNYGIFGYSCGEPAQQDFFMGALSNFTPMVSYTPTSFAGLLRPSNGSSEKPSLFNIHPTSNTYALAVLSFLREFNWKRLSIITEGSGFFEEVLQDIRKLAPSFNVTVFVSQRLATGKFLIPEYLRIIFMNMNKSGASQVLCQASNMGYVFPDYIWIAYAADIVSLATSLLSCSSSQIESTVDGMFTIEPVAHDEGQIISGPITAMMQNISDIQDTFPLSYYAVDSVLVLAHAINATLTGWSNNSPDWSFCERERSTQMKSISRCFMRQKLLNISLQGLTGEIAFTANGEREQHEMGLFQYRNEEHTIDVTILAFLQGLSSDVLIGRIDVTTSTNRVTFELVDNENETTLFRGPVPADSSPIKVVRIRPLAMIIIYYTLASAGIIFCFICFLFNIIFRKRKIVKLISPNLNYFIVLGAFLLYSSIYFRIYPSPTLLNAHIRCNIQGFMLCVGYVLCFAPVLMKMWRVFYIFHNPSQKKKALKDWHLTMGTGIIVGIILAILLIGLLVPVLRPNPTLIEDVELRGGVNEDEIETVNCIYKCYGRLPSLVMVAIEFVYLILLQVAAFVLAIITRNVKIKVLNDSKQMAIVIYTSSTVMLVLGVITFTLASRLILNEVLFGFGIMLATTIFLGLVFVPKMVDLYKDPRGEGIFGRNTTISTVKTDSRLSTTTTFTSKSFSIRKSFTNRKLFSKDKTRTI